MRLLAAALILGPAGRAVAQDPAKLSVTTRAYVSVDAAAIALKGVKVIDGTGAEPKSDQPMVIANGRIQAVGPAASTSIPAGTQVFELAGHTVIPGFAGMHDHTFYTTAAGRRSQLSYTAPKLYLASGVTTIRTTGSISPYDEINLKQQIDQGEVPGPRMHISGPYITGPSRSIDQRHIATPEEARRVVNYWADEGATWFKVYTTISRANLTAVTEAAHQRGLKVTGHLCSVGYRDAVAAGIDGLEHGLMTNLEYYPSKQPDQCPSTDHREFYTKLDLDGPAVQATFRDLNAKGVAISSTLAVHEVMVANRPPLDPRTIDAMSPEVQKEYLAAREQVAKGTGT